MLTVQRALVKEKDEHDDEEGEDGLTENVVQPMTLEADRGGAPTRGVMLDPSMQQDPKLRLEIGICGITKPDSMEVLEVTVSCVQLSTVHIVAVLVFVLLHCRQYDALHPAFGSWYYKCSMD